MKYVVLQRDEEMTNTEKKRKGIESRNRGSMLLIGLNRNAEIIRFNTQCEQTTGYSRDDALHRSIYDFLIPKNSIIQWRKIFDSVTQNIWPDEFVLPIETVQHNELFISWNCFPVHSKESNEQSHNLRTILPAFPEKEQNTERNSYSEKSISTNKNKKVIFKLRNTHLVFTNKPVKSDETKEVNRGSFLRSSKSRRPLVPHKLVEPTGDYSMKIYEENYQIIAMRLKELEKKDQILEKKNKILERQLKHLESLYMKNSKIQKNQKSESSSVESNSLSQMHAPNKSPGFLRDPFGVKKRRDEFEAMERELDENKQLLQEKETLSRSVMQLRQWKEKLEQLEEEIEKRRGVLIEQEKKFETKSISNNMIKTISETSDVEAVTAPPLAERSRLRR